MVYLFGRLTYEGEYVVYGWQGEVDDVFKLGEEMTRRSNA